MCVTDHILPLLHRLAGFNYNRNISSKASNISSHSVTMPRESSPLPFVLPLIVIFLAVTVFALPATATDFLRLPSNYVRSTSASLCPDPITPRTCPVKCFRTAPVCGVNNVTYWCGCAEAVCAGTRVAKLGFCEFENGPVSGQALLLVHILWLILLGFFVLLGLL
ncbi:hypothetical protein LXL04_011784 [Taraxacum kok-saghyz]